MPDGTDAVAAANQTTHVSLPAPPAPRLSEALLEGPASSHAAFKTDFEKTHTKWVLGTGKFDEMLKGLLQHIADRLEKGLLEAWCAPQAYDFRWHQLVKTDATRDEIQSQFDASPSRNTPDEQWARAFTEMVVFSMYGGIGLAYGFEKPVTVTNKDTGAKEESSLPEDEKIYKEYPRVYPVLMACQHLSTYCVLSRGYKIDTMTATNGTGLGCTASTVTDYPIFTEKKTFECGDSNWTHVSQLLKVPLEPGDVVVFNPYGPKSGEQPNIPGKTTHIGSVLRTTTQRIQWIDTGVLVGDEQTDSGEAGTVDHEWDHNIRPNPKTGVMEELTIPAAPFMVAWGKIKKQSDSDLVKAAEDARKSRPLGFVRLTLLDIRSPSNPKVIFVSKLLHMKYPVSRLIWSLRALPAEGVEAIWTVFYPNEPWASALMKDRSPLPKPFDICQPPPVKDSKTGLTRSNVICSAPGGGVNVFRISKGTWRQNFSGIEMKSGSPLFRDGAKLALPHPTISNAASEHPHGPWVIGRDVFHGHSALAKRYVRKPDEKVGTLDEGPTDVAYFDPK